MFNELKQLLEKIERNMFIPTCDMKCVDCKFAGQRSEALIECTLHGDEGTIDEGCFEFKPTLSYIEKRMENED
jgi:hypothetical protein